MLIAHSIDGGAEAPLPLDAAFFPLCFLSCKMWVPLSAAQGYCVDWLSHWIKKQAYNVLKCFRNASHYWYYYSVFNGENEGITRGSTLGSLCKH